MENGSKNRISVFLNEDGKIKQVPVRHKAKIPVLAYLSGKFEKGRIYSEKEVNQIIGRWHTFNDYFILRRLLVDHSFLARTSDGAKYWVVEKEQKEMGEG